MKRYSMLKRASALLLIGSLSGAAIVAQASTGSANGTVIAAQATRVFMPLIANVAAPTGATFTVNSTADVMDAKTGDGRCETVTGNGVCTLRAAIRESNSLAGPNSIVLPAGTYTLSLPGPEHGDLNISQGDLTITGAGATSTTIQGVDNLNERIFDISSGVNVTISGVTIRNGRAINEPGGGIYNKATLTLQGVEIRDNTAVRTSLNLSGDGGGIRNTGTLSIIDSTVANNSAFDDGGGILNNGRMTLVNVTVSNNRAVGEEGDPDPANGGGVMNQTNSTSPAGGAVTEITNSTIANNSSANTGGGIQNGSTASLTIRNTIVSYNVDRTGAPNRNCSGTIVSAGGNLENGTNCKLAGPNDKSAADPLLRPLQLNGGTTPTRALQPGSPAIDAGISAGCPPTDQRGVARNGACDIGAYEYP